MTPAQQAALETVAGRALTADEVLQIDPYLDPENRNDVAIADVLSVGRTKLQEHKIGTGDVLDAIGIEAGNALLDKIYLDTLYRYVKSELDRGDLDISRPLVRTTLDMIAADAQVVGFDAPHADILKSLALVSDPIHYNVVSTALNIAEGRPTI